MALKPYIKPQHSYDHRMKHHEFDHIDLNILDASDLDHKINIDVGGQSINLKLSELDEINSMVHRFKIANNAMRGN